MAITSWPWINFKKMLGGPGIMSCNNSNFLRTRLIFNVGLISTLEHTGLSIDKKAMLWWTWTKNGLDTLKVVSIIHSSIFWWHIFKYVTVTLSQKGNKLGCEDWTFWASFFPERYCQFYSTWTNIMPFIQNLSCHQSFFSMKELCLLC